MQQGAGAGFGSRRVRLVLQVVVSLLCLVLVIHLLDWGRLWGSLRRLRVGVLALCLGISLAQFAVMSLRWLILARNLEGGAWGSHLRIYLYASFSNLVSPANLGGDLLRVVAMGRREVSRVRVLGVLVLERLAGLWGYFSGFLFCWWLAAPPVSSSGAEVLKLVVLVSLGVCGCCLGVFLLARNVREVSWLGRWPRVQAWLAEMHRPFRDYSWAQLGLIMVTTYLGIGLWVSLGVILSRSQGQPLSWVQVGEVALLVEVIRLVPVSLQGIGVREAAYAQMFALLGGSAEGGFLVGGVAYLINALGMVVCGLVAWAWHLWGHGAGVARVSG